MRIAHVLNQVSVTASAMDQIQGSVAQAHSVTVVARRSDPAALSFLHEKRAVFRPVRHRFLSPLAIIELVRLFRRVRPDVIHLHHARSALASAIAARLAGIPCLVEDGAQRDNYAWATRILFTLAEMLAHRVVFVSHAVQASLGALERVLIRPRKCTVIHYGVDPIPTVPGVRQQERAALGIVQGETVFCHTGRFEPVKRQDMILELFAALRSQLGFPVRLLMVGDGPLRGRLEALAQRLGLTDAVVFTGMVSRDRVYRILTVSDFFIMMSRTEGHSVSLLEAMMAGCVPILSRIPSFSETVDDRTAIYFSTEAQLVADVCGASIDMAARKQLAKRFCERKYGFAAMMNGYHAIYRGLAASADATQP